MADNKFEESRSDYKRPAATHEMVRYISYTLGKTSADSCYCIKEEK